MVHLEKMVHLALAVNLVNLVQKGLKENLAHLRLGTRRKLRAAAAAAAAAAVAVAAAVVKVRAAVKGIKHKPMLELQTYFPSNQRIHLQ